MPFEFDTWRIAPDRNVLARDGEEFRVGAQVMAVLVYLADRPGQVVTRDELLDRVWGGRAITDGALTVAISELRKILDDRPGSPRYIETITGRGYRWMVAVRSTSAAPLRSGDSPRFEGSSAIGAPPTLVDDRRQATARWGRRLLTGSAVLAVTTVAFVSAPRWGGQEPATPPPAQQSGRIAAGSLNPMIPGEAVQLAEAGLLELERMTPIGYHQAADLFQQAADLAPDFALAHILLAEAHLNLSLFPRADRAEHVRRATNAAREALALDPTLPRAHLGAGIVALFAHWNLEAAEDYFQTAIQLDPDFPPAHERYAWLLAARGRKRAAVVRMRSAVERLPEVYYRQALGQLLTLIGEPREALGVLEPTSAWHPPWLHNGWYHRAVALEALGQDAEAATAYLRFIAAALPDEDLAPLRAAFRDGGLDAFHRAWLKHQRGRMNLLLRARLEARVGQNDEALATIREMIALRSPDALLVGVDGSFALLAKESELSTLLAEIRPHPAEEPPARPLPAHPSWLLR